MLEREIAAGGMARVYLATLRGAGGFEKRLVVKQIRPELASDRGFVERFVKEAKTAVELSHPNIVPVFELGVEQGVYYIAMEHCDGATLSELLATTGPLDPEEGAYLGVEVCRALDYAHRRAQVIHRDVTPRNVLIDEEGAVKLIDFGIAAPVAEGDQEARTEVFGSPGHMPPEQLAGHALTPSTDVFAVGVLLYEAMTGRPAFRRGSAKESRAALAEPQPALDALNSKLSPLKDIVSGAMQLDERARPPNAEALARPLRAFLRPTDAGDLSRRLGQRVRLARRRGRSSSPWLVGEGLTGVGDRSNGSAGSATPATPALKTPASGSQTFAASSSFTQLTRRVESEPPPGTGPDTAASKGGAGTRRIPSSRPPPPVPEDESSQHEPFASESAPSKRREALEEGRQAPGWRAVAIGLGLAVPVSVLAGWWLFNEPTPMARAVLAPAATAVEAPTRANSPAPSQALPVAEVSAARQSAPVRPASSAPRGPVSARSEPASASAAPAVSAGLSLTALPGTRVTVAGREYTTPVSGLSLPAGRYQVTFRNATWDGPVSTQIVLLPGKNSRVHADFTNEPPKVVVR